jgi:DNA-binding LacI/PurR family transcriptional regulator
MVTFAEVFILVTMRDVARLSGVSPSTVSRVVNKQEYVAEPVRQKVLQAIKELDYQPNLLAQSLVKGGQTRQIGLLVYDVANPFYTEIAIAMEKIAYLNNYTVILSNCAEGRETGDYLDMFLQHQVDGVALAAAELTNEEIAKVALLKRRNIPVIVCREKDWISKNNGDYAVRLNLGLIEIDVANSAKLATEYLISLGHKKIAFLFGPPQGSCATDPRMCGYRRALEVHGIGFDENLIISGLEFSQHAGARGMRQLLMDFTGITAVMAYNDSIAIGALAVCRENGISVPDDLSMVGFDNLFQLVYEILGFSSNIRKKLAGCFNTFSANVTRYIGKSLSIESELNFRTLKTKKNGLIA